jgi:hypothetical protein
MKKHIAITFLGFACLGATATASAQSFYPLVDTSLYSGGSYSSLTIGNAENDITAVFTASTPGHTLMLNYIQPGTFANNINGAAFFNQPGDSLDIQFSAPVTAFQINWVADQTEGLSVMDLSAYLDGELVGTSISTASHPLMYDEGAMLFNNAGGFDSLIIGLDPTVGAGLENGAWAMGTDVAGTGNFGVVTPAPEPSTLALAAMGGLSSLLKFRRRK